MRRVVRRCPESPTTVGFKEAEMRTLFVAYLVVITVGLVYFIILGMVHR